MAASISSCASGAYCHFSDSRSAIVVRRALISSTNWFSHISSTVSVPSLGFIPTKYIQRFISFLRDSCALSNLSRQLRSTFNWVLKTVSFMIFHATHASYFVSSLFTKTCRLDSISLWTLSHFPFHLASSIISWAWRNAVCRTNVRRWSQRWTWRWWWKRLKSASDDGFYEGNFRFYKKILICINYGWKRYRPPFLAPFDCWSEPLAYSSLRDGANHLSRNPPPGEENPLLGQVQSAYGWALNKTHHHHHHHYACYKKRYKHQLWSLVCVSFSIVRSTRGS